MDTPSPSSAKPNKARPLSLLAIVALVALVIVIDMQRRAAEQQLQALSVRLEQVTSGGNQAQNREAAKAVVDKVRKLYTLPADIEPTVATIVDVDELRKRNPFYNKAENGDYLIVTSERAILYDPDNNVILDVVPVQIRAETPENAEQPTTSAEQQPQ